MLRLAFSNERVELGRRYEQPTPIRRETIPPQIAGRDLLGPPASGTGTGAGKTGLPKHWAYCGDRGNSLVRMYATS